MDLLLAAFIILCTLLISIPILLIALKKEKKEVVLHKPFAIGFVNLYYGEEGAAEWLNETIVGRSVFGTYRVAGRVGRTYDDYYKTVAIIEVKDVHS